MIDIVDACSNFCPVEVVDGDEIAFHSWLAVALFLASEIMAFMDVEPNGILQAVVGIFKLK